MTTLLIDNYDSFTYNLYQYLAELGAEVVVHRNDAVTVDECEALDPERVVISPGPGRPADAGISREIVKRFAGTRSFMPAQLRSSGSRWARGQRARY